MLFDVRIKAQYLMLLGLSLEALSLFKFQLGLGGGKAAHTVQFVFRCICSHRSEVSN